MNFDLLSCVVNCGAIPEGTQLRGCLLDVYELEKEKLKQKIKEANVALMVDELGNDNGHCVIDIMATILDVNKLSPSGRNCLISPYVLSRTGTHDNDFSYVIVYYQLVAALALRCESCEN